MTIKLKAKEVLRDPVITVQAVHTEEINVLFSGLNSDGTKGNGLTCSNRNLGYI